MFSILSRANFAIWIICNLSSANAFNLDWSKILSFGKGLNAFPNNTHLDWSKLEVFPDDKISVDEKLKFVLETVENNIMGKGEYAVYQDFLLFP